MILSRRNFIKIPGYLALLGLSLALKPPKALCELVTQNEDKYSLSPTIISEFNVSKSASDLIEESDITSLLNKETIEDGYNDFIFTGTEFLLDKNFPINLKDYNYTKLKDKTQFEKDVLSIANDLGYAKEKIKHLSIKDLTYLSAKILDNKLDYNHFIAIQGNGDLNDDGINDGISKWELTKIPNDDTIEYNGKIINGKEFKQLAIKDPSSASDFVRSEIERINNMYADEIFKERMGVCRHYVGILPHIFNTLKKQSKTKNAIITPVAVYLSPIMQSKHAWNLVIGKDEKTKKIYFAAIDPTNFNGKKDSLNAFNPGFYDANILYHVYSKIGKIELLKRKYWDKIKETQDIIGQSQYLLDLGTVYGNEHSQGIKDNEKQIKFLFEKSLQLANEVKNNPQYDFHYKGIASSIIETIKFYGKDFLK